MQTLGTIRPDGSILLEDKNRDWQRIRQTIDQKLILAADGLQHVLSSVISAVGTSEMRGINGNDLFIRFHNGSIYQYKGMANQFDNMLKSNSKGRYFNRWIRKTHNYERIGSLPFATDKDVTDEEIFKQIDMPYNKLIQQLMTNPSVEKEIIFDEATGKQFFKLIINSEPIYLLIDKTPIA